MLTVLILLGIIIGIIEGIPLAKKKLWKELNTVMVLISIAVLLGMTSVMDMPKPMRILENFIYPFGTKIFRH